MKLIKSKIELTRKQKIKVLWMDYNPFHLTKHLYWKCVPHDYRPKEIYYRLKCFFWKRYTTVKGRYLPHTYMDAECILIHSMMEIVCRFVEKEMGYGKLPKKEFDEWLAWQKQHNNHRTVVVNGETKHFYDEILEIYHWWLANHEKPYHQEIGDFYQKHASGDMDTIVGWNDKYGGPMYEWEDNWDSPENEAVYKAVMEREREREKDYEAKLDEMLHRIVNLRGQLWS